MDKQKREFTGVWLPRHIVEDRDLSMTDKIIYAEIACFEVCYKSNEKLGERYDLKKGTIFKTISKLIKSGYIKSNQKTGDYRQLTASYDKPGDRGSSRKVVEPLVEKSYSLYDKNRTIEYSIDNNKKGETSSPSLVDPPKETYKSKNKIAKQKGIKLKTPRRSEKQEKTTTAFKHIDYFRDEAQRLHGFQFFKVHDKSRNAVMRKLVLRAGDVDGLDIPKLID